jgi:coenzyme F420-reducing hydrogenase gamma subunit
VGQKPDCPATKNDTCMKKLKIGWFTFTCCEDSTIIFTELLNQHWKDWKEKLEFVHAKVLQSTNVMREMDVAFVEGAIASDEQAEKLKQIRSLTKKLVAIGACACIDMPSSQRNSFDVPTKAEIAPFLLQFHHGDMVKKISDIVTVDAQVQGCPMNETVFLQTLEKYLKEFGII